MPLKGVLGVLHRFKKDFWRRLLALFLSFVKACWAPFWTFLAPKSCRKGSSRFALYQCDFSGCWTPFWGSCSPNLAKGVPQPVRLEFHDPAIHFLAAGALFGDPAAQIWQKGVPQPVRLEFHDPAFHFLAAGPLFVLPAFWIFQKGVQRHLISDFYLFPCAGPFFEP